MTEKETWKDGVILAVSNDKYELPVDMYSGIKEMSERTGMSETFCRSAICRKSLNQKLRCKFVYVKLQKDDEREV